MPPPVSIRKLKKLHLPLFLSENLKITPHPVSIRKEKIYTSPRDLPCFYRKNIYVLSSDPKIYASPDLSHPPSHSYSWCLLSPCCLCILPKVIATNSLFLHPHLFRPRKKKVILFKEWKYQIRSDVEHHTSILPLILHLVSWENLLNWWLVLVFP